MTPTNKLRFVQREIGKPFPGNPEYTVLMKKLILQQWWGNQYSFPETGTFIDDKEGEWRDIPIENDP